MTWTVASGYFGTHDIHDSNGNPITRGLTKKQAALMAAAPKLLEILEIFVTNAMQTDGLANNVALYIPCTAWELRTARAVVAKARGQDE